MSVKTSAAWDVMSILDEAEDMLNRLRLYDGRVTMDAFAEKRAALNEARERLELARALA